VDNNNNDNINNQPWERKGTLLYTLACTVKFKLSLTLNLTTKRKGKGREGCPPLPELGWLATYVSYISCVSTYLH
jgi:hypothetical protein